MPISICLIAVDAVGTAHPTCTFGTLSDKAGGSTPVCWQGCPGLLKRESASLLLSVAPGKKHVFRSHPLAFVPLTMYAVSLTARRGPGTKVRFAIHYKRANEKTGRRELVLQLPDVPRQGWMGLSPYRHTYVQNVCLPADAKESWLEISLEGHKNVGFDFLELFDLQIRQGPPVPFGERRGRNLLATGSMETAGNDGVPIGWTTWGYKHPKLDLTTQEPYEGKNYLSISPGCRFYLASALRVPVERGRAYEISFCARGAGQLSVLAHALAPSPWRPLPVRVGDAQSKPITLSVDRWTRFSQVWFAEALHVQTAEVVFVIHPEKETHIDAVEFRLIESGVP